MYRWARVGVLTGTLVAAVLAATLGAGADWVDQGIEERYRIHVFEDVASDGRVMQRLAVATSAMLGDRLALRTMPLGDMTFVMSLKLTGTGPGHVDLLLEHGTVSSEDWRGRVLDSEVGWWVIPYEVVEEPLDLSYSFSGAQGWLNVGPFGEVVIGIRVGGGSFVETDTRLR